MTQQPYSHLHAFQVEDDYFVMNSHTSRLYKINELMFQILDGNPEPSFPPEEIESHRQYLKEFEGISASRHPNHRFTPGMDTAYCTLDLQVSHTCNLACKYCYAGGGSFGGHDRQMSKETAKQALDFFFAHANPEGTLQIGYDGGEPLSNFDVIKDSALYASEWGNRHQQRVNFTVGTNATLVTDTIAEFFSRHSFSPQISLDGDREIQNLLRPFKNGQGSFDSLMDGLDTFNRHGVSVASRITLTPWNMNLKDQVERLHNLGAIRIAAFPATGITGEYAFREEDLGVLREEYKKTADFIIEKLIEKGEAVRFANLTEALDGLHNAQIKHYGCGAGRTFYSVNPEGNLYPCHRLVGNRDFLIGTLRDGFDTEKLAAITNNHVDSRDECRSCWARYLCGGGCIAESHHSFKDISIPLKLSCEIFKYEMEMTSMIYARILAHDKTLLRKFITE